MKKIFFALSMLTLLYTSCDPSTDSGSTGFSENVTAESVDAKATPVQVNGKNSNRIIIENHSPITSQWSVDQLAEGAVTSSKAYDTIYVTKVGANTVTMHCKNVAVDFTKDFTVNVDEITYLSAELQKRLCVTGSEGNYTSTVGEFAGQKAGGVARNGSGAWFTIDINNKQAIGSDGVKLPISVSVLEHKDPTWDKGTISFPTATNDNFVIPMGVNVNGGNAVFQKYYVLVASDDKLVLTAAELPENGCAWFYVFKKKAK